MIAVKICGVTRPDDAAAAVEAGADYLGVVFAGGPRMVSLPEAREIVRAAAGAPVIGVFGDQPVPEILRLCRAAGLAGSQLHGPYPAEAARALRAAGLLVWRVARVAAPGDVGRLSRAAADADAVLVEPRVAGRDGGAGVPLDPAVAVAARQALAGYRMVLAGGLRAETVVAALRTVAPDVVDVSSGVERQTGRKDAAEVARFLEAVRGFTAGS